MTSFLLQLFLEEKLGNQYQKKPMINRSNKIGLNISIPKKEKTMSKKRIID